MRRIRKIAVRVIRGIFAMSLVFALACGIGLAPVNRDFRPTSGGVEVYVRSNGVHTDIITPLVTSVMDWREMLPVDHAGGVENARASQAVRRATHIAFGWGDRKFYIETPTWDDVRAPTVLTAVSWPTSTVMHVEYLPKPTIRANCRRVTVSPEQYQRLVTFLRDSFLLNERNRPVWIAGEAYGPQDAFYEARGKYHLLYTCNRWTGAALKTTGVPVGCWTPFPWGVLDYLEEEGSGVELEE